MAGDPLACAALAAGLDVSIRARHRWRAIPAPAGRRQRCRQRFNPRPPSMAGDPSGNRLIIFSMAAFQSAPAIDGGRSQPRLARLYRLHQFQSAPAIDGGRSGCQTSHRPGISSFNPRPPSMAGDPLHARHHCHAGWVSIRARHRWRAILPSPSRTRVTT